MKWTTGGVIALSALITIGVNDISAQQGDEASREGRSRRGPGVEAIMRMQDELELTSDQLTDMDAIRSESVQRRHAAMAEMAEMRSQLAAGQIRRSDMMAFMEQRQEASAGVAEQQRGSIEGILTDSQRESLRAVATRGRSVRRSQARAGRAPGMRSRGNARRGAAGMRSSGRGLSGRPGVSGRGDARGGRASMRGRRLDRGRVADFRGARGFRGAARAGSRGQAWRFRRGPGGQPGPEGS